MKQNEKKRVVFYCRVATDDQRGTAMERQVQSLREYAEGKGYEIIKEIQEKGSGRTMDRTGIRAIYMLAGRRAMDEVLAVNVSRYGRCPAPEMVDFIESLADMGVTAATRQEGNLRDILPTLRKLP